VPAGLNKLPALERRRISSFAFLIGYEKAKKHACRHLKRIRGGLLFEAHRILYHSTLGSRIRKKKQKRKTRLCGNVAI